LQGYFFKFLIFYKVFDSQNVLYPKHHHILDISYIHSNIILSEIIYALYETCHCAITTNHSTRLQ